MSPQRSLHYIMFSHYLTAFASIAYAFGLLQVIQCEAQVADPQILLREYLEIPSANWHKRVPYLHAPDVTRMGKLFAKTGSQDILKNITLTGAISAADYPNVGDVKDVIVSGVIHGRLHKELLCVRRTPDGFKIDYPTTYCREKLPDTPQHVLFKYLTERTLDESADRLRYVFNPEKCSAYHAMLLRTEPQPRYVNREKQRAEKDIVGIRCPPEGELKPGQRFLAVAGIEGQSGELEWCLQHMVRLESGYKVDWVNSNRDALCLASVIKGIDKTRSWGASSADVLAQACEALDEEDKPAGNSRIKTWQGETLASGEDFRISYVFLDDKLVSILLWSEYKPGNPRSNRDSTWNPYSTATKLYYGLKDKYGTHKEFNAMEMAARGMEPVGRSEAIEWGNNKRPPFRDTFVSVKWEQGGTEISLSANHFFKTELSLCAISYTAKTAEAMEYARLSQDKQNKDGESFKTNRASGL